MAKKLKLTYFDRSECEVTNKVYSSDKVRIFEIDKLVPGQELYSVMSNVVKFKQKTPTGVIVKIDTIYTVNEGTVLRTSAYSLSGSYSWWYTFEIIDE